MSIFFLSLGLVLVDCTVLCRYKSSNSVAVTDDNKATILHAGSDSLSLVNSVALLLRLLFAVCI